MNIGWSIVIIIVLIILNGVFASCEMALVSVNKAQVEVDANNGKKAAKRVLKLINNPTKFLSAIQIGITLFGFLNGAVGANSIADWLVLRFPEVIDLRLLFVVLVTLVLTYFQVVLGELVPKRIAMKYPKKIAYSISGFLNVISILTRPFVWLLTASANLITKPLGINEHGDDRNISEEDIRLLVATSSKKGGIDSSESKMIQNVFEFDDTEISKIMTHRTDISGINKRWSKEEIFDYITNEKYTRYPVYEESIDHIIGTLNSKDLFRFLGKKEIKFDLMKIIRKPHFVPETKNTRELFNEMQKDKNHIAIVIDEYGGTSGIVTMEDLIEEVLGNIFDEYDDVKEEIEQVEENLFLVDGLANIDDIEEELKIGLPKEEYDTVSGFILGQINHIPEENEDVCFDYNGYNFKVLSYDGNVIEKVQIKKNPIVEEAE
ncbi:hemolysin family protein [Acholeplasma sp. OttesenSCG-928-E16]|nr:hemolysin family protein [Acholeplasma sp. OttesenSCG-928-E16]